LTALAAVAIAGTLTLGENPWIVGTLRALYRWPLFIPFIVAALHAHHFLAKNGLNEQQFRLARPDGAAAGMSYLDWRGIIITFVWKQPRSSHCCWPRAASLDGHAGGRAHPRRLALGF